MIRRVLLAEVRSQLRAAPFSTVMATVGAPLLAAVFANLVPRADLSGQVHLQRAGLSFTGPASAQPIVEKLQQELAGQSLYALERVPDAKAAWERKEVDLALALEAREVPGQPLQLRLSAWRARDYVSEVFLAQVEQLRQRLEVEGAASVAPVLEPAEPAGRRPAAERKVRHLAPLLLLVLGWLALSMGMVDVVAERERRTLEVLLSNVGRVSLAWALVLFHLLRSMTMLVASVIGLVATGSSAWLFTLVPVAGLGLLVLAVPLFGWLRGLDRALAGYVRVGTLTALLLPLFLFSSQLLGSASPLHAIGDILEGPPQPLAYARLLGVLAVLAALAAWRLPSLARRWAP